MLAAAACDLKRDSGVGFEVPVFEGDDLRTKPETGNLCDCGDAPRLSCTVQLEYG